MAAFNHLEDLRRVVQENPEIVSERFEPVYAAGPGQGPTLLGIALERGYREMALFLMESGAPIDVVENLGSTLLHKAARGGDPVLVRLLIAKGLDVDARDNYQDTPLGDVAGRDCCETVAALIEAGADVNARGMNQQTLHCTPPSAEIGWKSFDYYFRWCRSDDLRQHRQDRLGRRARTTPELTDLLEAAVSNYRRRTRVAKRTWQLFACDAAAQLDADWDHRLNQGRSGDERFQDSLCFWPAGKFVKAGRPGTSWCGSSQLDHDLGIEAH